MSGFGALVLRDLRLAWHGGGAALPVIFFLSVATLFPFAVGPDRALLMRTGGGMIWVAALLASLLPVERLILADRASGVLDQLALRGFSDELVAAAKICAHWLAFAPPLIVAALPASALMNLGWDRTATILAGLALATPGLAALGVMIAALTAGLRGAAALSGLLLVPIAVPLLIFGAGSLADESGSALPLLAACSLLLLAMAPFVAGAALRAGRS